MSVTDTRDGGAGPPIHVLVHYDFASSLCYVAHRVMERIRDRFEASPAEPGRPAVRFAFRPVDLAGLLNWRRGALVPEDRRANVLRVSSDLSVPVRVPRTWLDSRRAHAVAIALARRDTDGATEAAWRERVYTAIFEEGRSCDDEMEVDRWAADLGLALDDEEIETGERTLEAHTRDAAEAQVTGVPTFMLGDWPMGGIQDDETMVRLICRFALRARQRGAA